ncbi:amidohydrolase [Microdochium trichocladiopsis]|uniref:Amidohydrolase n=1 Tax=Microdochium trichocladiopsis TaxID=1682393 RepID=A0A9P9BL86_9PEZI|nr:amidohydrolase [Microdochium trichocladiopsis]KAH7024639.1 amidohydrolase [Microdochium trichocladiopsis]
MADHSSLLLRGGTLLLHDDADHVVPTVADILVEGSLISKIGTNIQLDSQEATRVIDVSGKIVGPGYVDTHHHLWQTQNKGAHANHTLLQYMPRGNNVSVRYSNRDLFYGQLSGSLEAIDGGTTTVVDHAHCNASPDHPHTAIQALVSSGLRCVYCLSPRISSVTSNPPTVKVDYYSAEAITSFRALAGRAPYGNGRIHIGATLDNPFVDGDTIKAYYAALRGTDGDGNHPAAKLITSHSAAGPISGGDRSPSVIQILHSHNLLGPDILISHANHPKPGDGQLYAESGAHVSSTPNTELQMGEYPVAMRADHYANASLGIDCHTWGAADIPSQMRLVLQAARVERGEKLANGLYEGKEGRKMWSRVTGFQCEDAYNLGTIKGAKAAGLEGEVGRLRPGYKADLVVYETESPRMLAAAVEDPVAAVVLHSCPADISMVVIDGVVRKEDGKLVDVVVSPAESAQGESHPGDGFAAEPGTRLTWKRIAAEVLDSRLKLKQKFAELDFVGAEEMVMKGFYWDEQALLEAQT